MPRVWALYEDEELAERFERVMATVGPEEHQYAMVHMTEALDRVELDELRARMPATS